MPSMGLAMGTTQFSNFYDPTAQSEHLRDHNVFLTVQTTQMAKNQLVR